MKITSFYSNSLKMNTSSFKGGIPNGAKDIGNIIEKEFLEYLQIQQSKTKEQKVYAQELVEFFNKLCEKYGEKGSSHWAIFLKNIRATK